MSVFFCNFKDYFKSIFINKVKIAFSIGANIDKYQSYNDWLASYGIEYEYIELCYKNFDLNKLDLNNIDGLVLCGGLDIEPARHGRSELNDTVKFNPERDEFESQIIKIALQKKIPILAICRGSQMFAVAMGGILYVDIPTEIGSEIEHRNIDGIDSEHRIKINSSSLLKKIIGESEGIVNSLHHESVKMLPPDLEACAYTDDGVVEAYEWKLPFGQPYLCAVQWHPEKLDWNSPFSKNLAQSFLFECETYSKLFNKNF